MKELAFAVRVVCVLVIVLASLVTTVSLMSAITVQNVHAQSGTTRSPLAQLAPNFFRVSAGGTAVAITAAAVFVGCGRIEK